MCPSGGSATGSPSVSWGEADETADEVEMMVVGNNTGVGFKDGLRDWLKGNPVFDEEVVQQSFVL